MICVFCRNNKPDTEFFWRNFKKKIRQKICKKCAKIQYFKKYERRNKAVLLAYLKSHPCVDCPEKDIIVLQFDHRDKTTKSYNIGDMMHHSVEAMMKEIEKCDVRCANCHVRRTAKQFSHKWRYRS